MIALHGVRRRTRLVLAAGLVGGGGYLAYTWNEPSSPTLQATTRAARLISTATLMVMDYQLTYRYGLPVNERRDQLEEKVSICQQALEKAQEVYATDSHKHLSMHDRLEAKKHERKQMEEAAEALIRAEGELGKLGPSRISIIHQKAAERLLALCRKNGGVYIKIGQHLANLDYLIPTEYIDALSSLFDDTPRTPFDDVVKVIEEDLGKHPEELFESFLPEPIASASLAQVHVAYEKSTGRKLAIKVQHRGLRESSAGDMKAVVAVVNFLQSAFEDFQFGWIAEEMVPLLPKELDFINEGRNAERAAKNIAKVGLDCVIPKIIWDKTSPRVLTMEFEEGFKATDLQKIEESGLSKREIAHLVSSVFSSQAFLSKFTHCDPHPANCLIRKSKNGKPQMVLVDHGLYRELDDEFCYRYASLWKALMLADLPGIKKSCEELGVGKMYTLFTAVLTARPFDELVQRSKSGAFDLQENIDKEADKSVIKGYAKQFLPQIMSLLNTVPRQMLLLLKMNDCLRHIDSVLGSPINTAVVTGKYAARGLCERGSIWDKLQAWCSYSLVLIRIQLYSWGIMIRGRPSISR